MMAHTHVQAKELEGLGMSMLKSAHQQQGRQKFLQEKQELKQ